MKNELDIAFAEWCAAHRKQMLEAGETVAAMAERNRMDFEAGYHAGIKEMQDVVIAMRNNNRSLAEIIGYPEKWDIKVYPTLANALNHVTGAYREMVQQAQMCQPYEPGK